MGYNNLRGLIIAKYRTILAFANAVKWSKRRTYDLLNGRQEMTLADMETICEALEIVLPSDIRSLFFP
jgi:hypothetical protein